MSPRAATALAALLAATPALADPPPPAGAAIIVVDGTSNAYGYALPGQGTPPPYRGSIFNCSRSRARRPPLHARSARRAWARGRSTGSAARCVGSM